MKIECKKISDYKLFLKEPSRPPSKGGNTNALHLHVIVIDGESYSFLSPGSQQWIFKTDSVSFEYEINGSYKNVVKDSVVTFDKNGNEVVRGNRGYKLKLRTASARLPGSKREQRD